MIALCKGKVSLKNAFSSNLNTINLKGFKPDGIKFIREVNRQELSNVVSCSVSLMLILAQGIDIFEKLTPEIRG